MQKKYLEDVRKLLPTEFEAESHMDRWIVIRYADNGFATIDPVDRVFSLGIGCPSLRSYECKDMAGHYKGRGWLNKLVNDAVHKLIQAVS